MADAAEKMAFLQRQSDQTRVQFLQTEFDTCFTLVGVAETELHTGLREHGRRSIEHAEQGYATLQRFLSDPKHSDRLTDDQQTDFAQELRRLRERLDGLKR